jgi:hypothetical protein
MKQAGHTTQGLGSILQDRAVLRLLSANLVLITLALYQKWDANVLVWIYWFQSMIIGVFSFLRIVTHQHLYRMGTRGIDGRPRPLIVTERLPLAIFLLFHYSGFHLVYLLLIASGFFARNHEPYFPLLEVVVVAGLFFVAELMSFIKDPKRIQSQIADLSVLVGRPYIRIVPMHITVLIGAFLYERGFGSEWIFAVFLVIKTIADIGTYIGIERGLFNWNLQVELDALPRVEKSPMGDKLVLSDGQIIDLFEHPELARDIERIFELPVAMRQEVVRGLLAKEKQEQLHKEIPCRCNNVNTINGAQAHRYAEHHLRLMYNLDDGSKLLVCPPTGKKWLLVDDTLKVKKP